MLERCAGLPLAVERVAVEPLERPRPGGIVRRTTLVRLRGGGREGLGEEVTFQAADLLSTAPGSDLFRGATTLGALWSRLDRADLCAREPAYAVVRNYRRWAIEAAALDLALKQAGVAFGEAIGRNLRPVTFVVSPAGDARHLYPGMQLKVDATAVEPGLPVAVVDFKGVGDERLIEHVLALYPGALLEDPPVLVDGARISWDIDIHSAADVARLPARPSAINVKPARLGSLEKLFELYAYCEQQSIALYGGGQDELGPGRLQAQLLAALFHPDAPNDLAPTAYNDATPGAGLPRSPLSLPERPGFG